MILITQISKVNINKYPLRRKTSKSLHSLQSLRPSLELGAGPKLAAEAEVVTRQAVVAAAAGAEIVTHQTVVAADAGVVETP